MFRYVIASDKTAGESNFDILNHQVLDWLPNYRWSEYVGRIICRVVLDHSPCSVGGDLVGGITVRTSVMVTVARKLIFLPGCRASLGCLLDHPAGKLANILVSSSIR